MTENRRIEADDRIVTNRDSLREHRVWHHHQGKRRLLPDLHPKTCPIERVLETKRRSKPPDRDDRKAPHHFKERHRPVHVPEWIRRADLKPISSPRHFVPPAKQQDDPSNQ